MAAAERNLVQDPDWAYSIDYNAALQAARALVLAKGYRPRGSEQHSTVVQFIEQTLGHDHAQQVTFLDQMRRKRRRVVYEVAGLVSPNEAEQAIAFAKGFVEIIRAFISRQTTFD